MDIKEIIFKAYKDKAIITKTFKNEIAKNYKLSDDDVRNLYIRINNYQVKKYGCRLEKEDIVNRTTEELAMAGHLARDRKRKRRIYFLSGGRKHGK